MEEKIELQTYRYLRVALKYGLSDNSLRWPVRDAFLLAADDYFAKKINLEELSSIVSELWSLGAYTDQLTAEDPLLFGVFDLIAHWPKEIEKKDNKKYLALLQKKLKSYYDENKLIVKRYTELKEFLNTGLSGDLKVRLK